MVFSGLIALLSASVADAQQRRITGRVTADAGTGADLHHRASADAFATAHIFINLLTQMQTDGVRDIATIKSYSSRKNLYVRQPPR